MAEQSGNNTLDKAKQYVSDNWIEFAIATGLLVGGYAAYQKVFHKEKPQADFDQDEPEAIIDLVTARTKAEQLFNAMRNPGTDEAKIFDTLSGLSYNDFIMVSNEFGMRYYDNTLGTDGGWFFNDKFSLHEWLLKELSNSELEELEKVMPGVLLRGNKPENEEQKGMNKALIEKNFIQYA